MKTMLLIPQPEVMTRRLPGPSETDVRITLVVSVQFACISTPKGTQLMDDSDREVTIPGKVDGKVVSCLDGLVIGHLNVHLEQTAPPFLWPAANIFVGSWWAHPYSFGPQA